MFWNSTLIDYSAFMSLFKTPLDLPDTFTTFRVRLEKDQMRSVRALYPAPKSLSKLPLVVDVGALPTLSQLTGCPTDLIRWQPDVRTSFPFTGGESSAINHVREYIWERHLIDTYKQTRNGLLGAEYSTKFSPWLAHGCLSAVYLYDQIKKYEKDRGGSSDSSYWVIFELLWRDYFKFYALKFGKWIFFRNGTKLKHHPQATLSSWKRNTPDLMRSWAEGRTGYPFLDANMKELALTGFMSNRGRQNVASFLTKDLHVDWLYGAELFESLLLDYDPAANYGNWQYVAGVGNDPREDRYFNVVKQSTTYDPDARYIRTWLPELRDAPIARLHDPCSASIHSYPTPLVRVSPPKNRKR